MKLFLIVLTSLFISIQAQSHDLPKSITLASTDWCPYVCENQAHKPGIIHEYLTQVLKDKGIELKVEFNQWHESVKKADLGQVAGLLTATPEEAPSLLFTQTQTADYQVCFITRSDSKWLYKGDQSLSKVKLGSIKGYGYGDEVDQYIKDHNGDSNMRILEQGGIEQLNDMLFSEEIDTYLDDSLVVLWLLQNSNIKVKLAGCLQRHPFYLAVNPRFPWAKDFIKLMNEALSDNVNLQLLNAIKQKYR